MHRPAAGLALVALLALTAAAPAAPRVAKPPLHERVRRDSLRLAAGVTRATFDSLARVLAIDVADARRTGDTGALRRLLLLLGAGAGMTGDARRAVAALDEALPLIEHGADTAGSMTALRWRAYAHGAMGRLDEQARDARRLQVLARASGSTRFEAIAHNFLGWNARQRGDLKQARSHLERAVEGHRAHGNEAEEAFARIAYGATLVDMGDFAAARRSYGRQLAIARRLKQGWTEAQAFSDLGVLERRAGDPSLAARYFRRAYEGLRARGETPELVAAIDHLAVLELELGRFASGRDLARQGLAICERRGYTAQRGALLTVVANAEELLDRPATAEAAWRAVAALGDSVPPDTRAFAALGLSRALRRLGRDVEALAVVERAAADVLPLLPSEDAARFHAGHASRLWSLDRFTESEATATRAIGLARGEAVSPITVSAWATIASCRERLGRDATARAAYDSACAAWERQRGRVADPSYRASLWNLPGGLRSAVTGFLLRWPTAAPESARVAAAWERSQAFRARTLLERASRAGHPAATALPAPPPALSLARVQRELLADGELALEWLVGDRAVWLFAITRHERRAFRLAPAPEFETKLRLARDVIATTPRGAHDAATARSVSHELARTVFGDALPLVERARSLLLVPDGPVHVVPFAALATPSGPLLDTRAIATTPSLALLAQSRARRPTVLRGACSRCRPAGATGRASPAPSAK